MIKRIITSACLLNLAACASIVEGSSQNITIDTNPAMSVACKVSNERGSWGLGSTPGSVTVKRSKSDLNIFCDSPTHSGELTQSADAESWGIGNVVAGGIIGVGVDAGTGALFSYNDEITVPLKSKVAMAVPAVPVTITPMMAAESAPAPKLIMAPTGNGLAPVGSTAPRAVTPRIAPAPTYRQPSVEVVEPTRPATTTYQRPVIDPNLSFRRPAAAPVYGSPGSQF